MCLSLFPSFRNGFFSVSFSSQWLPLSLDSKLGVTSMQSHCFLMAGHRVIKYMFSYYISLLYSTFFYHSVHYFYLYQIKKVIPSLKIKCDGDRPSLYVTVLCQSIDTGVFHLTAMNAYGKESWSLRKRSLVVEPLTCTCFYYHQWKII